MIDDAGDIVARTKARLRLAKAHGEMGCTQTAERSLRKIVADAARPNVDATAMSAAREALAYLKILKARRVEAKQKFGKMFKSTDGFYKEEEQDRFRKQAKLDAELRTQAHVNHGRQTAHVAASMEMSQHLDWRLFCVFCRCLRKSPTYTPSLKVQDPQRAD